MNTETPSTSNYSVKFSDDTGRVSIVDKITDQVLESFSPCIPDAFIVQRMGEIRHSEKWRQKFMMSDTEPPSYEKQEVLKGGLIVPDGY